MDRADPPFRNALTAAAKATYRPERALHHYLHMAKGNFARHCQGDKVRLKKLLYVLRPLLAALWIEQRRDVPPTPFAALVEGRIDDAAMRRDIDMLLARKMVSRESDTEVPPPRLVQ
ncbi:MAG: nucleotidyltransferase, partial [Deltaproteobacteria bacterium]